MPRPRFTIRDIIFVVIIFALALGWFVDRQRILRVERERAMVARMEAEYARAIAQAAVEQARSLAPPSTPARALLRKL
jgi:hypothetical protein